MPEATQPSAAGYSLARPDGRIGEDPLGFEPAVYLHLGLEPSAKFSGARVG